MQDEALSLLFMLSYCEVQRRYPCGSLTAAQQQLVLSYYYLGLIYLPPEDADLLEAELDEVSTLFRHSFCKLPTVV